MEDLCRVWKTFSVPSQALYLFYGSVLIDLFVALAILLSVAFTCEWSIRREARKKLTAPAPAP